MTLHEFVQHLAAIASQLDRAKKTQLARSSQGLAEKLGALPDVELNCLAEAVSAMAGGRGSRARKVKQISPEERERIVQQANVVRLEFDALRECAHQSTLSDTDILAFKKKLSGKTVGAPVVAEVCVSLSFGVPKTKTAGIEQLVNTLRNSQLRSWRR